MVLSAIGSMVLGTLGAMSQKLDLKRLLAYSAIGNAGYMLLGIASGNLEGLQGILLFAVIYMVMTMNAFATLLALKKRESANPMSMAGSVYGSSIDCGWICLEYVLMRTRNGECSSLVFPRIGGSFGFSHNVYGVTSDKL